MIADLFTAIRDLLRQTLFEGINVCGLEAAVFVDYV